MYDRYLTRCIKKNPVLLKVSTHNILKTKKFSNYSLIKLYLFHYLATVAKVCAKSFSKALYIKWQQYWQ